MDLTTLGLEKPGNNDAFGQDDFNENQDRIDAFLQAAGLNAAGVLPRCDLNHSLNQSLTSGVDTILSFDFERFDSDGMHDVAVNNSRIIFKTAGDYICGAAVLFAANATGLRRLVIDKNAGTFLRRIELPALSGTETGIEAVVLARFALNDFIEARARQDSGGALSVIGNSSYTPAFWAARIG
jgi:hypothetical protein